MRSSDGMPCRRIQLPKWFRVTMVMVWAACVIALLVVLLWSSPSFAATKTIQLTCQWSYPVDDEPNITGFEIYDSNNAVVISNIAKTARAVVMTITWDGKSPQAFWMRAVDASDPDDVGYSDPSNIYIWGPTKRVITIPGTFTVH